MSCGRGLYRRAAWAHSRRPSAAFLPRVWPSPGTAGALRGLHPRQPVPLLVPRVGRVPGSPQRSALCPLDCGGHCPLVVSRMLHGMASWQAGGVRPRAAGAPGGGGLWGVPSPELRHGCPSLVACCLSTRTHGVRRREFGVLGPHWSADWGWFYLFFPSFLSVQGVGPSHSLLL